jgi:hypothetical protein
MKAVRYVGNAAKLSKAYLGSLAADSGCTVINSIPGGANVTLRLTIDTQPLEVTHDPVTRDFLDLATLIYIVDEIEARGDDWTREFEVLFPVKNCGQWAANEAGLGQMLTTLTGDKYRFSWCERPALSGVGIASGCLFGTTAFACFPVEWTLSWVRIGCYLRGKSYCFADIRQTAQLPRLKRSWQPYCERRFLTNSN